MKEKIYGYSTFFVISLGAIPAALIRWQINDLFLMNVIFTYPRSNHMYETFNTYQY